MSQKVFDMGKNIRFDGFPDLLTDPMKGYIQGRVEQFALDLFATGRATFPNGEVVYLFDDPGLKGETDERVEDGVDGSAS
jgi:hypothetical protein